MIHTHAFRETPRSMEEGLPRRCACGMHEPSGIDVTAYPVTSHASVSSCPHCGVVHPDPGVITVRDPDDEIVGCGVIHIERMDRGHVWIGMEAADGTRVDLDLHAVRGRLRMRVR